MANERLKAARRGALTLAGRCAFAGGPRAGLLIELVHRISVRAERKVENELSSEFRRVHGKQGILFKLAAPAVDHPDELVRTALYPVVGEATLRDLVAEARADERTFSTRVRVQLRSCYSHHYRRGLPKLLKALRFRCNNTAHKPVMDALDLLERYDGSAEKSYAAGDVVPLDHVVPDDWRPAVVDERGRVERIPYELCVLVALRAAIRRREIWVESASQWRNPDDDLPADFDASRDVHYQALGKPRDPAAFIAGLREQHATALGRLNDALAAGSTGGVKITARRGEPWVSVPHIPRQPEPANLKALKEEIARRWGIIDLLNLIKDADHVTGFTAEFTSVASRQVTDPETLHRRLLLVLFGLGTNMGIKRVADGAASASGDGGTADSEAALRRVRPLFIKRDNLRGAIRRIVNETLAAQDVSLWGHGTSCASDSVSTPSHPGPVVTSSARPRRLRPRRTTAGAQARPSSTRGAPTPGWPASLRPSPPRRTGWSGSGRSPSAPTLPSRRPGTLPPPGARPGPGSRGRWRPSTSSGRAPIPRRRR